MQKLLTMPWGQRAQGRQKVKVTKAVAEPQGWTLQLHLRVPCEEHSAFDPSIQVLCSVGDRKSTSMSCMD